MSKPETLTVWVTKWALTKGIQRMENTSFIEGGRTAVGLIGGFVEIVEKEGFNWHRTESGAAERANDMKAARIASLRGQISNIELLQLP